jgi:hypothetical protein
MNYELRILNDAEIDTLNDAELDAVTGGGAIVEAMQYAEMVGRSVADLCSPHGPMSAVCS